MDTSMTLFMLIFLFSLVNSQLLSQVPNVEEMARTPFILTSGELYRDMLTVETSKLAALYAKKYQPQVKQLARKHQMNSKLEKLRQPLPNFLERRVFENGTRKQDDEIFDFTDSRFVNPPATNRQNFPLIEEEVPLNEISADTGYSLEPENKANYQSNPTSSHFVVPPTTPHASFTRFKFSRLAYSPSPKPYIHSVPSYSSTPQTSYHSTYEPSYQSTPQPLHHPTFQPAYHSTPQPSHHLAPQPSYHSTPQPSYHSTPQPSHPSAPQPSYHSTPQPSYHSTPQPSYHSTPQPPYHSPAEPSYHTTPAPQYHSIISSYSTPKPFVNLGSRPYSGGYSHKPPTLHLSDPTQSPRNLKATQKYSYSPTPLPGYSQNPISTAAPSYQRFSIGKSAHIHKPSYKSYTDHHLSNKGNLQKHPQLYNRYQDYESDYSTNYVKPLKPFIHPSDKQPPSAHPSYLSYHPQPSQYSSARAHIPQPSLSLFPQAGYGVLRDHGFLQTL